MSGGDGRIEVVAAVIRRGDRYLVCRRPSGKRHGGLWEFPGGKLMRGESRAEAIRRELAEELELEVTGLGEVLFVAPDEGSLFDISFVATTIRGTPVLHEHTELGWFTQGQLGELPLAPADARFAVSLVDGAPNTTS